MKEEVIIAKFLKDDFCTTHSVHTLRHLKETEPSYEIIYDLIVANGGYYGFHTILPDDKYNQIFRSIKTSTSTDKVDGYFILTHVRPAVNGSNLMIFKRIRLEEYESKNHKIQSILHSRGFDSSQNHR